MTLKDNMNRNYRIIVLGSGLLKCLALKYYESEIFSYS